MNLVLEATVVHVLGSTLLHFLWQGALLHAMLAVVLRFIPDAQSSKRYSFACATLCLLALAPLTTAAWLSYSSFTQAPAPVAILDATSVSAEPEGSTTITSPSTPSERADTTALAASPRNRAKSVEGILSTWSLEQVLPWMVALWLLGSTVLTVRLAGACWLTRKLRTRRTYAAPKELVTMSRRLAARLRLTFPVTVVQTNSVSVPMVVGALKPLVLLPASAVSGLSLRQLELLLAHELAHIKRFDPLVNLLQNVVETLLFYHPSVWRVSALIRAEREYCCDALTLKLCNNPVLYASTLRALASPAGASAASLAATGSPLLHRVRRILTPLPTRGAHAGSLALGLLLSITLCATGLASLATASDTLEQLAASPTSVTSAAFSELLDSAPEMSEGERYELLRAAAPVLPPDSTTRHAFEEAAASLPSAQRNEVLAMVVQDEPDASEPVLVEPNETPNYRSQSFMRPPLLEPGFDLSRARLATQDGADFPPGRQFVRVQLLVPPLDEDDTMLEDIDLEQYRSIPEAYADNFHVVLTKYAGVDQTWSPDHPEPRAEYTVEDLHGALDAEKLEGPWQIWVDAQNIVTRRTSIEELPIGENFVVISTPTHYACVEDGVVLATYGDYWLRHSTERFQQLLSDCIDGNLTEARQPLQFGDDDRVPAFTLEDGSGNVVSSENLLGSPFVITTPAPIAEEPQEVQPGTSLLKAVRPAPAVHVQQLQERLDGANREVPLLVLALPYAHDGRVWSAAEVAAALRERLDVPVYEDASGTFLDTFSQHLSSQNTLLLFNARGQVVDVFWDLTRGEAAFPFQGRALASALEEPDLYQQP